MAKKKRKPRARRDKIFVAYSRKDKRRLEDLQVHLAPLVQQEIVDLWDDTRIKPGARWKEAINAALASARAAVLLVSPDFLASRFITTVELPLLLDAAESGGAVIYPVIVRPCLFKESDLGRYQTVNSPDKPLNGMTTVNRDKVFVKLAKAILDDVGQGRRREITNVQSRENDVLECALAACHDLGLYPKVTDASSPDFAGRRCMELIRRVGASCEIEPPYNPKLRKFRKSLRDRLKGKKYKDFKIYLQRLCDEGYTWRHFCSYHADRLREVAPA